MSIHCIEQKAEVDVFIKRKGDKTKVGSKFTVKLADYKVQGKEGIVGKKVGETIAIKLNLKGQR